MKTIKEVDVEDSHLIIKHENGYLQFYPYHDYKRIKSSNRNSIFVKESSVLKRNSSYSKDELIKFQNILLKAYVYSNDLLDGAIEKSESKDLLDEYKEKVIATRKTLRNIVKYIDSYDELLENYKDI